MDLNNSIRFDARKTSNYPEVRELVREIEREVNLRGMFPATRVSRAREALKTILMNLWEAEIQEKCIAVSRRREDYSLPKRYGLLHFRYRFFIPLLDKLLERNYIHQETGFWDQGRGSGRVTRIWGTDKLRRALSSLPTTNRADVVDYLNYGEVIQLKDTDKKLVKYQENSTTYRMRKNLSSYNNLLSSTSLSLPHPIPPSSSSITGNKTTYLHDYLDKRKQLYRIFNRSRWDRGGRFYGAAYQGLRKKKYRRGLLLNGSATTELDYSSLHLSMCYHLEGITPSAGSDPYALLDNPDTRPLGKKIALVAFNARSPRGVIGAFDAEVRKSRTSEDADKRELAEVYDRLGYSTSTLYQDMKKKHGRITKYINSDIGIWLQYEDSKLTEQILVHFTKQGIPVLPVHDSYIIPSAHAVELKAKMMEIYEKRFGFTPGVK